MGPVRGVGSEEILLGRRFTSQREENEQEVPVPQILPCVGGTTKAKVLQESNCVSHLALLERYSTVVNSVIRCLAL